MMRVVVDDLAEVRVDAIVRPADSNLDAVSTAHARLEELGRTTFREIQLGEELAVGSAVVTDGGGLASNLVIHAIIKEITGPITAKSVARATTSTLHRAVAWELKSIAFPPLGTGPDGLSVEQSAHIMLDSIKTHDFTLGFPVEITVVVQSKNDADIFGRVTQVSAL